ncbi:MAG TPA: GNAT family N-acetyltransferase [Holophagaceae bacterium]|nr:GNAT family N-acetyltransferase [Holophagaceae bacterium]
MQPLPQTPEGSRYTVRPLSSADFRHLRRLEAEIWGEDATGELCAYYLRLCTEIFPDWCFLAFDGERPVGYALNFANGKVAYCATLAVHPDYQKTRVNYLLIRETVKKLLAEDMEQCRFLVEPGNDDARSVHHALGARVVQEVQDFYQPGDTRLWSIIDRSDLERVRERYTRLKLVS